jgi:hypothetical protein
VQAGALLALFLNPPQTIYGGLDNSEWLGCCKDMAHGTCYRLSMALVAFLFFATACSIASLVFIVAATLEAAAAACQPNRKSGSSAAVAAFIASKWMLSACVNMAYLLMLLYTPIAYPTSIFILVTASLGSGWALAFALFWRTFWTGFREVRQAEEMQICTFAKSAPLPNLHLCTDLPAIPSFVRALVFSKCVWALVFF